MSSNTDDNTDNIPSEIDVTIPVNKHCQKDCNEKSDCKSIITDNKLDSYFVYDMCKKCPYDNKCNVKKMNNMSSICNNECKNPCTSFETISEVILKCNGCPKENEDKSMNQCYPESESYNKVINNYYNSIHGKELCIQKCNQSNENIQQDL